MMGTIKVDPKKYVYHSTLVIENLMLHFFETTKQIPPKDVPTRVYDASTSRVNTSKLKEQLNDLLFCHVDHQDRCEPRSR
jgi:hypothetical protein